MTERIEASRLLERQAKELAEKTGELEYSQAFLNLVIDSLPSRIFWKDMHGNYLGASASFATDAGLAKEELIGKTDFDMPWAETQADDFTADDREVQESGQAKLNIIERQLQASGHEVWIETNKVPLRDLSDEVVGVLGTYQDVTNRIEAEQVLRKRSAELEILTELSRVVTTSTEALSGFLPQIVNFIKNRFNLYHAHIYLVNELKDALILSAGAGEAGRIMVEEGRRISLDNPNSLVARSARGNPKSKRRHGSPGGEGRRHFDAFSRRDAIRR
ncbi:MAG: PAS domain S-box protein, partial [Sphaerospermopsis sp. SIO1G2]|nr:PAS domain S-box protein [Sphaerospermopsis sp. SIO1G2]